MDGLVSFFFPDVDSCFGNVSNEIDFGEAMAVVGVFGGEGVADVDDFVGENRSLGGDEESEEVFVTAVIEVVLGALIARDVSWPSLARAISSLGSGISSSILAIFRSWKMKKAFLRKMRYLSQIESNVEWEKFGCLPSHM